jgi:hypothetical protein
VSGRLARTNLVQLNLENKDIDGVELNVASPQVLGQFVLSDGDSLGFSLPAGTYEIRGYVRPCDANCGHRGGSADECRTTLRIESGETLYAVRFQREHACSIVVSSSKPQWRALRELTR